ncbi:MAG: glycine--tRNA ligase subunit beta [Paracoccaceae bacterium]
MPDLLIELLSEEIPARMQRKASSDLEKLFTDGISELGLTYESSANFSTPRRLTLVLQNVSNTSLSRVEEKRGPRKDAPEKAIQGFLTNTGLELSQLEVRQEKKGEFYYASIRTEGREAAVIISAVLDKIVRNFPWPKSMRWGESSLKWVRPLHSLICILYDDDGSKVVEMDIEGISSGDKTFGHRFMGNGDFSVNSFEDYASKLKKEFVILDPSERAEIILQEIENQAFAQGLELINDPSLLDEVVGLIEWPVVLMGKLEDQFLSLPPEVLQTSMREHQKFFSVLNPKNKKVVQFATVANRETSDNGSTILAGNQKVLSARLADAKFFWDNDLRIVNTNGLDLWLEKLKQVTFHNKLGNQFERVERITNLSGTIAKKIGCDPNLAKSAASISKSDLSSEMVYEFPELQGVMGTYYAIEVGFEENIANACKEHYAPLGPSDEVPKSLTSIVVALADKIDTLTSFWAINEKPTGSKDPFALRRSALGLIRIIIENDIRISLSDILALGNDGADIEDLKYFIHQRMKVFLRDQSLRHDLIDACLSLDKGDDLALSVKKSFALMDFIETSDGSNLIQGFKRANKILLQAEQNDGVEYSYGADPKYAEEEAERNLFYALDNEEIKIRSALEKENFVEAMNSMANLRTPIDSFFETVQINSDVDITRRNRLNLLSRICKLCLSVADLTKVEG